jgi:hypothetical protein
MNKQCKDACIGLGGSLLFMGALYGFSWLWYMQQEHGKLALAQPPSPPIANTRNCADYTPAKLIALLSQLYTEGGFAGDGATTSTALSLGHGGTGTLSSLLSLPSSPDRLRTRARELLAQAEAEERRESFLAEVQWVIKECGQHAEGR